MYQFSVFYSQFGLITFSREVKVVIRFKKTFMYNLFQWSFLAMAFMYIMYEHLCDKVLFQNH